MTFLDQSRAAVTQKLGVWLAAGIFACLITAVCLFYWVNVNPQRVPYLNVHVLPADISSVQVKPDMTLNRPLFWAGRRPIEPVVLEVQEERPVVEVKELVGVKLLGILAKGNSYTALLEVDGKVQRVQSGEVIQQWTVSRITAREVYFNSRGAVSKLAMKRELHQSIKLGI